METFYGLSVSRAWGLRDINVVKMLFEILFFLFTVLAGAFDYSYYCEPCPKNTYNDAEDSTCKPITK